VTNIEKQMEDAEKISRIKARNDIDKNDPLIVA
jgi:hypothetical protein